MVEKTAADKAVDVPAGIPLKHLAAGKLFRLEERLFYVQEKKRTRILCREKSSGRLFLISGEREIEPESL